MANVEPLDEIKSCSRKALVTVVSTNPKRQLTVVTATNIASGSVIRCDVEIDVIDSIEIITTTREIVLEDLPEILEVKAKNDKSINRFVFFITFLTFELSDRRHLHINRWHSIRVDSESRRCP